MNRESLSIPSLGNLTNDHVRQLYQLCQQAGAAILEIYQDESRWQASDKADDTPVTAADIASSNILVAGLPKILNCPVVSEEALPSYQQRKGWPHYWLVDPMDGTKEFIHKTGEFVINIALMHEQQPVFGLLYQPQTQIAWWGGPGFGAFSGHPDDYAPLPTGQHGQALVALGSRRSKWQGQWRDQLERAGYQVNTQSVGSALKFARLAEGAADLYPRLGLTSEWDTAAPQAILAATGGAIVQWNGQPLEYGKQDTLNPYFLAVRDKALLKTLLG